MDDDGRARPSLLAAAKFCGARLWIERISGPAEFSIFNTHACV